MRKNKLNFKCITFCLFLVVFSLLVNSYAQPPAGVGQGGRRMGQSDHFGPPQPPAPFPGPQNPPSQFDFPRAGGGPLYPDIEMPAREVLERIFIARVASQLKLSDEQTVLFLKKFIDLQEQTKQLMEQRKKIADSLRADIKKKSEEINKDEIANLYNQLLETDKKIFEAKKKFVEDFSAGLELEKKAELYLILSDFEEEIKKFLKKAYEWRQRRIRPNKPPSDNTPPPQEPSE